MVQASLEKSQVNIGFIALTDCAPVVIAKERGLFSKRGLDVALIKQPSWASVRDQLMIGAIDGAHILAPMMLSCTLGLGAAKFPMVAGVSLGLNGSAITVSSALYKEMLAIDSSAAMTRPLSARSLKAIVAARKGANRPPLTFAMTFPFSMHNYLLRYWLAAGGVHPDRDVRMIVVPPPQMSIELAAGNMDGFCVGSPWNQAAVLRGDGCIAITSYELWNNGPDKVLGVPQDWAAQHPNTHTALIAAIIEASLWLDNRDHLAEAADIMSASKYVNCDPEVMRAAMTGRFHTSLGTPKIDIPDYHVFHRHEGNFPWVSHAAWILNQMYRWGQLETPVDLMDTAREVYQPDLYRKAAATLGLAAPSTDTKLEGSASLGPDRFLEEVRFDPARAVSYLEDFDIHSLRISPDKLAVAG